MWVGWEAELPGSLDTREWLPQRPEGGWETCLLWSINPNSSGSLLGYLSTGHVFKGFPRSTCWFRTHTVKTQFPGCQRSRQEAGSSQTSSQCWPVPGCWLVPEGQRSPRSVVGWFTLDIILRQMLLFLCFVVTVDLGSVMGGKECAWSWVFLPCPLGEILGHSVYKHI